MCAHKFRLEDPALHRVLPCKTVFALYGCGRTRYPCPTGFLCLLPVTLTSVRTKFHARVRIARLLSLPSFVGWLSPRQFLSMAGSKIGRRGGEEKRTNGREYGIGVA